MKLGCSDTNRKMSTTLYELINYYYIYSYQHARGRNVIILNEEVKVSNLAESGRIFKLGHLL